MMVEASYQFFRRPQPTAWTRRRVTGTVPESMTARCAAFKNWSTHIKRNSWRLGMGILALAADERVTDVKFTRDTLSVALGDGRTITVPLAWYPRLFNAT